jgi:hypothetical protein
MDVESLAIAHDFQAGCGALADSRGEWMGAKPGAFSPSYEEAQVCHFDGWVTFGLKMWQQQRLRRGPEGCDLGLYVGTRGRPQEEPISSFLSALV